LDAWFDVTTANHGDIMQSLLVAVFVEVPSALALLWVARLAVIRLFFTQQADSDLPITPIYRMPLTRETLNEVPVREVPLAPEADH
jgi:hypothetical protein